MSNIKLLWTIRINITLMFFLSLLACYILFFVFCHLLSFLLCSSVYITRWQILICDFKSFCNQGLGWRLIIHLSFTNQINVLMHQLWNNYAYCSHLLTYFHYCVLWCHMRLWWKHALGLHTRGPNFLTCSSWKYWIFVLFGYVPY